MLQTICQYTNRKEIVSAALAAHKANNSVLLTDICTQYPQYQEQIEMSISFYEQINEQLIKLGINN